MTGPLAAATVCAKSAQTSANTSAMDDEAAFMTTLQGRRAPAGQQESVQAILSRS